MHKGIDGLRVIVESTLAHNPYTGHLFVFVGKARDKVKILFWDRSDFVTAFLQRSPASALQSLRDECREDGVERQ